MRRGCADESWMCEDHLDVIVKHWGDGGGSNSYTWAPMGNRNKNIGSASTSVPRLQMILRPIMMYDAVRTTSAADWRLRGTLWLAHELTTTRVPVITSTVSVRTPRVASWNTRMRLWRSLSGNYRRGDAERSWTQAQLDYLCPHWSVTVLTSNPSIWIPLLAAWLAQSGTRKQEHTCLNV